MTDWVVPHTSRTPHTKPLLPLLPSGPDGVHSFSLRGDQYGTPLKLNDKNGGERDCSANPCAPPFGPSLRDVQNCSRQFCRTLFSGSHTISRFLKNRAKYPYLLEIGGERGIRTLDKLLTYTHFPGVLLQPLGHLSKLFFCHSSGILPKPLGRRTWTCKCRGGHGWPRATISPDVFPAAQNAFQIHQLANSRLPDLKTRKGKPVLIHVQSITGFANIIRPIKMMCHIDFNIINKGL